MKTIRARTRSVEKVSYLHVVDFDEEVCFDCDRLIVVSH